MVRVVSQAPVGAVHLINWPWARLTLKTEILYPEKAPRPSDRSYKGLWQCILALPGPIVLPSIRERPFHYLGGGAGRVVFSRLFFHLMFKAGFFFHTPVEARFFFHKELKVRLFFL